MARKKQARFTVWIPPNVGPGQTPVAGFSTEAQATKFARELFRQIRRNLYVYDEVTGHVPVGFGS